MPKWTEAQEGKLTLVFADYADLAVTADDLIKALEYLKEKYKGAKDPIAVVLDIDKLKLDGQGQN